MIASIKHSQFVKKMIKIPLNIQDFYLETEDVTKERAQRVKPYQNKKITKARSDGLVVKSLDSRSRGP